MSIRMKQLKPQEKGVAGHTYIAGAPYRIRREIVVGTRAEMKKAGIKGPYKKGKGREVEANGRRRYRSDTKLPFERRYLKQDADPDRRSGKERRKNSM